jgi:hypothetical protein
MAGIASVDINSRADRLDLLPLDVGIFQRIGYRNRSEFNEGLINEFTPGMQSNTHNRYLSHFGYLTFRFFCPFTPLESPGIYAGDVINRKHQLLIEGAIKAPSFLTGFTLPLETPM